MTTRVLIRMDDTVKYTALSDHAKAICAAKGLQFPQSGWLGSRVVNGQSIQDGVLDATVTAQEVAAIFPSALIVYLATLEIQADGEMGWTVAVPLNEAVILEHMADIYDLDANGAIINTRRPTEVRELHQFYGQPPIIED